MRRFLANENFDGPSVRFLREQGYDIMWIVETSAGSPDDEVMRMAEVEQRTIMTHDSDYGELIFKYGHRPKAGVVCFRIPDFLPTEPARILLELINDGRLFDERLTVIDRSSIRERSY